MADKGPYGQWFQSVDGRHGAEVADAAYQSARKHLLQSHGFKNSEQLSRLSATSIDDVQRLISQQLGRYEAKHESSKIRKWLHKASEAICHYGTVLDVFVQHHPEYVSLAWGAMKLLFVSVVNHGETLKLLAKTVSQVGNRLPRTKIMAELYPTEEMQRAIQNLYSEILKFLLMAHEWCNESKLRHIYHSFTRPHQLRYSDLLNNIEDCTREISEVAAIGNQAELRTMRVSQGTKLEAIISTLDASDRERRRQEDGLLHVVSRLENSEREHLKKLDLIISLLHAGGLTIDDLLKRTDANHAIQTSAQLDTNQRLSDLQLSQALSTFSLTFQEPQDSYQRQLVLRNRRKSGMGAKRPTNEFWLSPKLETFSSDQQSSLIIMKGHFTTRWAMQDFGIDVITNLRATGSSIAWALPGASKHSSRTSWSSIDLIKYLVWQVLRLNNPTEKQMAMRCSQFQTAQTVGDWMEIFKNILNTLQGRAYIVADFSTLQASLATTDGPNLIQELDNMVRATTEAGMAAKLKIILLLYDAHWFRLIPPTLGGSVVPVKMASSQRAHHRSMRQHAFTKNFPRQDNRGSGATKVASRRS